MGDNNVQDDVEAVREALSRVLGYQVKDFILSVASQENGETYTVHRLGGGRTVRQVQMAVDNVKYHAMKHPTLMAIVTSEM